MSTTFKPWGGVDPLFPAAGEVYVTSNGFFVNDVHGGKKNFDWLEKNFEAKEDDVYVVSYPKTGTTWVQEIVYCIMNDLDFAKAKFAPLDERFPYMELSFTIENESVAKLPQPRLLKSHYPYSLLPQSIKNKRCKIIYPMRNPKDTLVSYYHFMLSDPAILYQGDFPTLLDLFVNDDRVLYSPFWKHTLEIWELRKQDNIFIIQYEDLKKDMNAGIRKLAEFLGKSFNNEDIQKIADHCSFKSMKENKTTNMEYFMKNFIRKGEVGDWKNHFTTEEMNKKMDAYINKHFQGSGLQFQYSI